MRPLQRLIRRAARLGAERGDRAEDWRVLAILGPYRLLLVAVLLFLFRFGYAPDYFATVPPRLFGAGCLSYAVMALLLQGLALNRRVSLTAQTFLHFAVDLAAIGVLVYSTGGVGGGLGVLLVPPLVGCSLVLPIRLALVLAAAATLLVLGEEALRQLRALYFDSNDFSETGLLGLMFFATSLTAAMVGQRARRSEAAIERVGSEYLNLSQLNDSVIASMHAGVLVIDAEGLIRSANVAARRLSGGATTPLRPLAAALPALHEQLQRWQHDASQPPQAFASPAGLELMPRFTRLGWNEGGPTLIMLDDAAELRAQAQQLKLAALGRLSASIAHEIRNPLSAITQAGQLLAEQPDLSADNRRLLDMVQRHAGRIEQIVRNVLDISRRELAERQLLPLRETILRAVSLYHESHPQMPRPVEFGEVPAQLQIVFAAEQLQQLLFNLWDNSFTHAGSGGAVSVLLEAGIEDDSGRPYLDVIDNGPGIPARLHDRIFEPFFTTHAAGTGLGLYLCRELCEYNHARLVHLPRERGACFRIVFSNPSPNTFIK